MAQPQFERSKWVQPISDMIGTAHQHGGFFVVFSEYRPDLCRTLARELGFDFLDFREQKLRPLGWAAGRLPLEALTQAIEEMTQERGLVVHNAEALLAAKERPERQRWLGEFVQRDWQIPVIIPMAIFVDDLPSVKGRLHRTDVEQLPGESLLMRLAHQ